MDEALLDELVRRASPGDRGALAPTLAPLQGLTLTTPAMARRDLLLGDQEAAAGARWVVVFRRSAYWPAEIRRMVEEDKYCVDILTQTHAVRKAIEKLEGMLLEGHLESCVPSGIREGREDEVIAELKALYAQAQR